MDKSIFALLIIAILSIPFVILACLIEFKRFWTNNESLNMTTRKIRELNKRLRNKSNTDLKNIVDSSFSERRSGLKDRRRGIADRRKKIRA